MADQELATELKNAWTGLREKLEQREEEQERYGEELADTKAAVEKLQEQIDKLEVKKNRRELKRSGEAPQSEATKAFGKWLRNDRLDEDDWDALVKGSVMPPDMEKKDLTVGSSGNQSDAIAPEEFVQEIIKDAVEISPMRQVCRTRTTARRQLKIPVLQGRPAAAYTSEQGTRSDDTSTDFGSDPGDMLVIDMHEFYVQVPISRQMERDSVFDIQAEVREVVTTEMSRFEGEKFLQGTGSGQAQGLVTSTDFNTLVTADTASDDISAITADEVIEVKYQLKQTYRDNGTYALTREGLQHVRTLKDNDDDYLWQPGLALGEPSTIQGSPYVEMQDLVSGASAGAGDTPIAFGDWNRGYLIVDRLGMQVLRDPYSKKNTGTIDYQFYMAHGGDIRLAEALVGLEIG